MKQAGNREPNRRNLYGGLATAATVAVILNLSLAGPVAAAGDCAAILILSSNRPRNGDLIELRAANRGVPKKLLAKAVAVWERCPNYGVGFPAFRTEASRLLPETPARLLTVRFHLRSKSLTCGRFRGHEIDVYAFAQGVDGRELYCGSPELVLAHELGHVLGLADGSKEPECREQIMAYIDGRNLFERRAHNTECETASRRWLTASELQLAAARVE